MAGTIPNVEEERILTDYVRNIVSLRLFSNNYTPVETSTLANFTEVTGGGYLAIDLAPGTWMFVQGDPTTADYPEQTFAFTGVTGAPGTVYGYYLVDTVTGLLIGAERFPGAAVPYTPVAGASVKITPHVGAS
jgi:hypothetical protein